MSEPQDGEKGGERERKGWECMEGKYNLSFHPLDLGDLKMQLY